jgi:hypothetical protein
MDDEVLQAASRRVPLASHPLPNPSPLAGLRHSHNFFRVINGLWGPVGDFAKSFRLMGEGRVGLNDAALSKRKHQIRLPRIRLLRTAETLGSITPTLARPHQGDGNTLAICEYPRLRGRGGWGR